MLHSACQILLAPSRAAFERVDLRRAQLGRALVFAAGAGLAAGFIGASLNFVFSYGTVSAVVMLSLFNAIRFVVALLVTQGVIAGLARGFGARGNFERQAYLAALFNVPLNFIATLASGLNSLLPGLGLALGALVLLYQIVLTAPLLRALYGDEWRAATWLVISIAVVGNLAGGVVSAVLPQ